MPFEIVKPGTHIDFIGKWRIAVVASLVIILAGLLAIPFRGVRLGVDFAGGTEVQVRFTSGEPVATGDVRRVVEGLGIENPDVIRYGGPDAQEFLIKFRGERTMDADVADAGVPAEGETEAEPEAVAGAQPPAAPGAITAESDRILALEDALGEAIGPISVERVEFVGPKAGAELRDDGLAAIGIACLLVLVYIGFRFSTRYAPGAVVALVHDVLVTASVWILLGLEFDLQVLAALLAILGYSLNDTIIIYDRIRENLEVRTRYDIAEVVNRSVNQTLSRTILTSGTTLVAVLALLFLGGSVIFPFSLAMAIGIVVGTYSTVYVASPMLLLLERRLGETAAPVKSGAAPAATGGGGRAAGGGRRPPKKRAARG